MITLKQLRSVVLSRWWLVALIASASIAGGCFHDDRGREHDRDDHHERHEHEEHHEEHHDERH